MRRKITAVWVCMVLIASGFVMVADEGSEGKDVAGDSAMYTAHAPIFISGDEDFATQASAEGWAGNGTEGNPYIIQGYEINGTLYGYGYCMLFEMTTVYFEVLDCNLHSTTDFDEGIFLYQVQNARFYNNTITATMCAFDVGESSYNRIENNYISNNMYGLYLWYSSNITITRNTISSSSEHGIYIDQSAGNTLYHNNILGNLYQAYSDSTNQWDDGYPSGGNYWSDYNGTDGNGDGIGDTPYYFDGGQDDYPLMEPWSPTGEIHMDSIEIYTNALQSSKHWPFWSDVAMDSVKVTTLNSNRTVYPAEEVWVDPITGGMGTTEEWLGFLANASYSKVVYADVPIMDVSIRGVEGTDDLDLAIFLDGYNGNPVDGIAQWNEIVDAQICEIDAYGSTYGTSLYAYCADADDDEALRLTGLPAGNYIIKVIGFTVPGDPGYFEMNIDLLSEISGVFSATASELPLDEFSVREATIAWDIGLMEPDGKFNGGLYIGTNADPYLLLVPIELYLDRTPPVISEIYPTMGEIVSMRQPNINAFFSVDYNVELDTLSPRLYVDGSDVTSRADVRIPHSEFMGGAGGEGYWSGTIEFTPEKLANGNHTIHISVADLAGNVAYMNWTFTVDCQPAMYHVPEIMANVHYSIPINAVIESEFDISSALLHYKGVGQGTFTASPLSKIGTNTYYGQIPAQSSAGAVQYYLTAEDAGGSIVSSPALNPVANPHTVAVHPYGHPIISHDPVLYHGDSDMEVSAVISDDVAISSATLYFKNEAEGNYTPLAMANVGGHVYSATIFSGMKDSGNLTYYIIAADGQNNTVSHPININEPHQVEYMSTRVPGGDLFVAMQDDIKSMNPIV
ncbi:MAG: NosD domain-containing protein, partial [Thermoplasmata archaeon]